MRKYVDRPGILRLQAGEDVKVDTSTFNHVYGIRFDDGPFDDIPDNWIELENPLEALADMLVTP